MQLSDRRISLKIHSIIAIFLSSFLKCILCLGKCILLLLFLYHVNDMYIIYKYFYTLELKKINSNYKKSYRCVNIAIKSEAARD